MNNLDFDKIQVSQLDANEILRKRGMQVVDLDPFGSSIPYLDAVF